jgi:NADH:ubiquinone oxidoreductase subunit 4 (subunit M)
MFMGPVDPKWAGLKDISRLELAAVLPLAVLMVVLGLFPSMALGLMDATLTEMTATFR